MLGQISAGVSFEKGKVESSIYAKTGIALESTYYSLFFEGAYEIKRKTLKNQNEMLFQIPLWIAYKNYNPLARGEEHYSSAYFTLLHIGTGLNLRYNFNKKLSVINKIGAGIGPKYINAGDFRYDKFEYQKITVFPNFDLSIMIWLNKYFKTTQKDLVYALKTLEPSRKYLFERVRGIIKPLENLIKKIKSINPLPLSLKQL